MEHPNAPVQSPPTQFHLGHGQGNLPPSSSELTSRELGRLNPGLFDSDGCYLETSPVYFKVTYVANPDSPLVYYSDVEFKFLGNHADSPRLFETPCPHLDRTFGARHLLDCYSSGADRDNRFLRDVVGSRGYSSQVIMPRLDGKKAILPSQMSTLAAIEAHGSHTRHHHNHYTSVLGHSANDTVIDWQLKSLVNVLKAMHSGLLSESNSNSLLDVADHSIKILHQELILLEILVSGSDKLQDKPMEVRDYWEMLKCSYQFELGWPWKDDSLDRQIEYKIPFFPEATQEIVRFDSFFPYDFGDRGDTSDGEDSE